MNEISEERTAEIAAEVRQELSEDSDLLRDTWEEDEEEFKGQMSDRHGELMEEAIETEFEKAYAVALKEELSRQEQ